MKQLIVGFGHKRRRGKNLAAEAARDYLISLGIEARIDSFAYALKEGIAKGVFGLSNDQVDGKEKEVVDAFWQLTPRQILQLAGTEAMRTVFGVDVWCRTLERRVRQQPIATFVTDVRFFSEVQCIRKMKGTVVRVDRYIESTREDFHASETALDAFDDWDFIIDNNDSLPRFYSQIKELIDHLLVSN